MRRKRLGDRRDVQPLLVGERHDDRALVDPVGDLVGPGLDDLVRARDSLRAGQRRTRVDDGGAPAELLAVGAERLGGRGGAEDHDAERALDHLGEDAVVPKPGRIEHAALESLLTGGGVGIERPVAVLVEQRLHLAPEGGIGLLDPDVDLAAAGEADFPGLAVGDAVVHAASLAAFEDLLRPLDDVGLDTAAGDGSREGSVLTDDHLRARLPWRRADRVDDGREHDSLARARRLDHVEMLVHHGLSVAPCVEMMPLARAARSCRLASSGRRP